MGFLSKYSGTKKVDLGDGYYAEVRKYLSSDQQSLAEQALTQPKIQVVPDGKGKVKQEMVAAMNYGAMRTEIVVQALVSWNLTDENDQLLPFAPEAELRKSLSRLPGDIVRVISESVGSPDQEDDDTDRDTFPGEGEAGA